MFLQYTNIFDLLLANFMQMVEFVKYMLKNMLSIIVKRYMREPVKTYFGLLKIQVKF